MSENDPRISGAWETYRNFLDHAPPHQVTQQLRSLSVPEDLIAELIKRHEVETTKILELKEPLGLGRENTTPWYTGPRKGDRNWPAFEAHLRRTLDSDAVDTINEASEKVVAMLDHPATPGFDSRGLVVGHVQSGKTSNFTAVICKAADRGYRMFIVLSGVHNALRRQTQTRLIRDVVRLNPPLWHQITTPEHDFTPPPNPAALLAAKDQHLLLVVKKNAVVLRKLKKWLADARAHLQNCPALLIDDEADQATIATKSINPLIADVLRQLPRVCYVGYTATPFANLLADPVSKEDFYPRDFILSLPRSEDYQGPETLFGRSPLDGEDPADVPGGLDMIREIPDGEVAAMRPAKKADIADFEPGVTPSLRKAALWFWLSTAARRARSGKAQHSSMLVHAHSDTRVHDSYKLPLEQLKLEIGERLAADDDELLAELCTLWETETARVPAYELGERRVACEDVMGLLPQVVADTKIIMDHYRSTNRLDYESGAATVIAVGGNTLSRGLTLEGLVVSVFVRSSDVYDTLLQMGRWFGYRPGYKDLPRIYMPAEMRRWFTHLATVEAEMRGEIDRLLVEHKTPLEMAVRIRCHPKMRVTAPSKQKAAVRAAAAYGGALVESRYFPAAEGVDTKAWHADNADAVTRLLEAGGTDGWFDRSAPSAKPLWRDVPGDHIFRFVSTYRFHEKSIDASANLMAAYIEKRMNTGGLTSWNVGVIGVDPASSASSTGREPEKVTLPGGSVVGTVVRTRLIANSDDDVADIKTLTGSRDEGLDLNLDKVSEVNRAVLQKERSKQQPEKGLVLLYPIDATSKATKPNRADLKVVGPAVVWGAALVFPKPVRGQDVEVEYDYLAADLSRVFPAATDEEPEDVSVLDQDLDTDVPVSAP
ncbi:Z1 domain-containing protein [Dactylosporangium fulvum]|uniref:Z1 domain-containing protein n=1 Tax=Dactylosporangium fulvum TaxID=53359 RepID=A0ABY5VZA2_9ACTN|nr:Z1 domain-containing protein [Dactylosporangium fulvum]UWP83073.1 Z1 domain-containing protein [Dactylosporangium fulvum]